MRDKDFCSGTKLIYPRSHFVAPEYSKFQRLRNLVLSTQNPLNIQCCNSYHFDSMDRLTVVDRIDLRLQFNACSQDNTCLYGFYVFLTVVNQDCS